MADLQTLRQELEAARQAVPTHKALLTIAEQLRAPTGSPFWELVELLGHLREALAAAQAELPSPPSWKTEGLRPAVCLRCGERECRPVPYIEVEMRDAGRAVDAVESVECDPRESVAFRSGWRFAYLDQLSRACADELGGVCVWCAHGASAQRWQAFKEWEASHG
ncbi:hypothetical protein [Hyalangium gracile]|uniref:hypothetical protein n=1 Tax=Hyalangium gracile TaxID=394092 RepID=UPI001CCFE5D6|nr:hypothetical protein [Hyalangium gracile]